MLHNATYVWILHIDYIIYIYIELIALFNFCVVMAMLSKGTRSLYRMMERLTASLGMEESYDGKSHKIHVWCFGYLHENHKNQLNACKPTFTIKINEM